MADVINATVTVAWNQCPAKGKRHAGCRGRWAVCPDARRFTFNATGTVEGAKLITLGVMRATARDGIERNIITQDEEATP